MSNEKDFVIEKGVLKKYTGPGGDVVIPDGVTRIGKEAFKECENLTGIVIPDSVTSIGRNAFYGTSLTTISLPKPEMVAQGALAGCTGLTHIAIPDGVTSIGEYAFGGCSLTSIVIPNSVTSIGWRAFYCCSSLSSIVIPDSVTSIGREAFYGCRNLTIHAPAGSYAETYAGKYHIPFIAE